MVHGGHGRNAIKKCDKQARKKAVTLLYQTSDGSFMSLQGFRRERVEREYAEVKQRAKRGQFGDVPDRPDKMHDALHYQLEVELNVTQHDGVFKRRNGMTPEKALHLFGMVKDRHKERMNEWGLKKRFRAQDWADLVFKHRHHPEKLMYAVDAALSEEYQKEIPTPQGRKGSRTIDGGETSETEAYEEQQPRPAAKENPKADAQAGPIGKTGRLEKPHVASAKTGSGARPEDPKPAADKQTESGRKPESTPVAESLKPLDGFAPKPRLVKIEDAHAERMETAVARLRLALDRWRKLDAARTYDRHSLRVFGFAGKIVSLLPDKGETDAAVLLKAKLADAIQNRLQEGRITPTHVDDFAGYVEAAAQFVQQQTVDAASGGTGQQDTLEQSGQRFKAMLNNHRAAVNKALDLGRDLVKTMGSLGKKEEHLTVSRYTDREEFKEDIRAVLKKALKEAAQTGGSRILAVPKIKESIERNNGDHFFNAVHLQDHHVDELVRRATERGLSPDEFNAVHSRLLTNMKAYYLDRR